MTETIKESATILDATAGNRRLWNKREDSRVLWIDIEPELEIKPDILLDCTNTGFESGRFNLVVFDPPHMWGYKKNEIAFSTPSSKVAKEKWPDWYGVRDAHGYYGADKYQTKEELMEFIFNSEKEFHRILRDEGVLLLKWNDRMGLLEAVIQIFSKWEIMLKIPVQKQKGQDTNTFWLLLMKKEGLPITAEAINRVKIAKETSLEMF